MALSMMAMMGVEMMLPLYMQQVHGLSPLSSGLTLLPCLDDGDRESTCGCCL